MVEINFVDVLARRGACVRGTREISSGPVRPRRPASAFRSVCVEAVKPISSPPYDIGAEEEALHGHGKAYYRDL
ncbi:hypothetical protein C5L14_26360 [Labrys okinawensis]|uniref:Uncharacterized protein n=1 Tax=Labrys okinawensis TaxID=346911 RepID=A0A2S9Q5U1_9HYPH|nr:hypothetical protein [Labrys okinawensis]PRH84705.1 hypothetical protein C5L14_26360 [Labrys okinawensis]